MLQDGGLPTGARALALLRQVARFYATPHDVDPLADRLGHHGLRPDQRAPAQRRPAAAAVPGPRPGRPPGAGVPRRADAPGSTRRPGSRSGTWSAGPATPGTSVVLTTHAMDEAERLADQVAILARGRLVASGTPRRAHDAPGRSLEDVYLDLTGRALS